jgi:hypothetical protein
MREANDFWEELLAQIEAGQVIPVVGPELLWAALEGREIPLYQALAERLLAKYGLVASVAEPEGDPAPNGTPVLLRPYHELNDAVCALARRGRRVQDLYRPINELLKALVEAPTATALEPLRDLASVGAFRLFVTTTPDDLLARAINAERHGGMAKTEHIVFAPHGCSPAAPGNSWPSWPGGGKKDIPDPRRDRRVPKPSRRGPERTIPSSSAIPAPTWRRPVGYSPACRTSAPTWPGSTRAN